MQAKRWQRGPSSATSTLPQAGQNSSIAASAGPAAPSGDGGGARGGAGARRGAGAVPGGAGAAGAGPAALRPPAAGGAGAGAGGRAGPGAGGGTQPRLSRPCRPQVTAEEIGSQVALEYGQAMTVRVCKADGEIVRESRRERDGGGGRGPGR